MFRLHDDPTLGEIVAALISLLAVGLIGTLAISGNPAAQTSLVAIAGAAAGTYFQTRNGNGRDSKPPTPPPSKP